MPPLALPERFERYRIDSLLGSGGMGSVFAAFDTRLKRRVALKILHPQASSGGLTQILREARAAAALDHPNSVQVFDVGEVDGTPFMSMEYVNGTSLRAHIVSGSAPLDERLRWLCDVARALAHAHGAGLVHRDIKPENVMVRADGVVKVLDFGIAKRVNVPLSPVGPTALLDSVQTASNVVAGTPLYMAPEQLRGEPLDPRCDQFAWGLLAYETLGGRLPWSHEAGAMAYLAALMSEPAPPLTSTAPTVPETISEVVGRALAKSREDRFPSMNDLLASLGAPVSGSDRRFSAAPSDRAGVEPAENAASPSEQRTGDAGLAVPGLPRRGRRPTLAGVGIVLLLVGVLFAATVRHPFGTAPAASAKGSAPTASVRTTGRIRDLPVPESKSPEAREAYRLGLEAYSRTARRATALFHEALDRDPSMTPAIVRILVPATWSTITPALKDLYDQASNAEARLPERDRDILRALDSVYHANPVDRAALGRKLELLLHKYPGDGEIALLSAVNFDPTRSRAEILAAFDRAQRFDDSLVDAFAIKLQMCAYFGEDTCVQAMDRVCRERFPTSGDCLWFAAEWREHTGQCDEMEELGRSYVAAEAKVPWGYRVLAEALASLSKPAASVELALKEAWSRDEPSEQSSKEAFDRGKLAALTGDFEGALNAASRLEELAATSRDQMPHGMSAYLRIYAEAETGQRQQAVAAAKDFLDRRDGWDPPSRGEDFALAVDMTPLALRVLGENKSLPRLALDRRRSEWASDWAHRFTGSDKSFLWLYGWASPVIDADGAREAQAHRAEYEPIARFGPRAMTEYYEGVTDALAGRVDEAVERLSAASKTCRALLFPFEHTGAHAWLGKELELKGDPAGACRAYGVVVTRWGHAKPRSITAEKARARMVALRCDASGSGPLAGPEKQSGRP